jgi:hypothetical protein
VLTFKPNLRFWEIGIAGQRHTRAPLANLAVTDGDSVRLLCFNNDAKSTALAARGPRHGNSPGNSNMASSFSFE